MQQFLRALRLTSLVMALAVVSGVVHADSYVIDREHTEVRFSWNHLGLSRQSGRFLDIDGTVSFEPAEPEATYAEVAIKLAGLSTGVPALDEALTKGREYFDVETFPVATFRSTAVGRTGGRTAQLTGDLTLNGVTKPVVLDVTWNFTGDHPLAAINPVYAGIYVSGFSAKTQILRSDFGITRSIPYVSDEIQIEIETEMHRKQPPEAASAGVPRLD